MNQIFSPENIISLVSLSAMEIVLGIDNIVFLAILSQRVAPHQQKKVRKLGLSLALGMRLMLLFTISWIMGLTAPLFTVWSKGFSGRDLVLLGGGLFLIAKATHEIHDKLEVQHEAENTGKSVGSFGAALVQIIALDLVFSLDSVITAVGMAPQIWIMVVAMVLAVGVMLLSADAISAFITRHPSMKVLALSFLLLIGVLLVAEGFGKHIEKGYIYFAMAFSFLVELLNLRMRRKSQPVVLHHRFEEPTGPDRPQQKLP
jgi:predicted tellurium resistance membrane protein TerC